MIKSWSDNAWEDYLYWHNTGQKQIVKKINRLIKDIARHPYTGIGKPEALKLDLTGKWSRRINERDRLIYKIDNNEILLFAARGHYEH